jgi:hypothetical protein
MRALLVFALVLTLQVGCTAYFDDDFEADPVGQPPLEEPAGPPEGDFLTSGGTLVSAAAPLAGAKSAVLGGSGRMTMFTAAVPPGSKDEPLYLTWRTSLLPGAGSVVRIVFGPNAILRIAMEYDQIEINGTRIGFYHAPGAQRFNLAVYPEANKYRLTVSGDAEVPGTVTGYTSENPIPWCRSRRR